MGFLFCSTSLVPLLYPLKLSSMNDYFWRRYESRILKCGAGILTAVRILIKNSVVLVGTCLTFEYATGLPAWVFLLLYSASSIIYTSTGGLKAVIWTDVLQAFILLPGMLIITVYGVVQAGGLSNVVAYGYERFTTVEVNPDPRLRQSLWSLILYFILLSILTCTTAEGFQRIYCVKDIRTAQKVTAFSGVGFIFCISLGLFEGIVIFAYFSSKGCDPVAAGEVNNINKIVPYTIIDMFQNIPGMTGLVLSGVLSASLSTLSSGLSGIAFCFLEEVVKILCPDIPDVPTGLIVSKISVLVFGTISALLALIMFSIKWPLQEIYLVFTSSFEGSYVGVLIISMLSRRAGVTDVLLGFLTGSAFTCWVCIGRLMSNFSLVPGLPSGPIDDCFNSSLNTLSLNNTTSSLAINVSNVSLIMSTTISSSPTDTDTGVQDVGTSGLSSTLYSISYAYAPVLGFLITVIVSVIASFIPWKGRRTPRIIEDDDIDNIFLTYPWKPDSRANVKKSKPLSMEYSRECHDKDSEEIVEELINTNT